MRLSPFRALRPNTQRVEEVACPPYDVINTAEARSLAKGKPGSFLHVIRPEINEGVGASTDLYQEAAQQLARLQQEEALVGEEKEALWLYRLVMDGREQVGVVGCAEVDAYAAGTIKRHEFTRPDKEDDRTKHVDTVSAHTGPVFLACKSTEGLNALQSEWLKRSPFFDFTADDGIRHTLWKIDEGTELARAAKEYAAIDAFYIADGHHRAASANRVRDLRRNSGTNSDSSERFLVVVFPEDQLEILAYNRVVADLNGKRWEDFLEAAKENFEISAPGANPVPEEARSFCAYHKGEWRLFSARSHALKEEDPVGRLDVALLQDLLLAPELGIDDPRRNQRIQFVGGIRGTSELEKLVNEGADDAIAFSMYPTSIQELFAVADSGEVMPPKSTWFEPKLRSGLLIHPID